MEQDDDISLHCFPLRGHRCAEKAQRPCIWLLPILGLCPVWNLHAYRGIYHQNSIHYDAIDIQAIQAIHASTAAKLSIVHLSETIVSRHGDATHVWIGTDTRFPMHVTLAMQESTHVACNTGFYICSWFGVNRAIESSDCIMTIVVSQLKQALH